MFWVGDEHDQKAYVTVYRENVLWLYLTILNIVHGLCVNNLNIMFDRVSVVEEF